MAPLNLDVQYDKSTDVLYVTLGTNEPSYSEEIDDILIIDRGFFSGSVTGFRILDVKHHDIKAIGFQGFLMATLLDSETKALQEKGNRIGEMIQQISKSLPEEAETALA